MQLYTAQQAADILGFSKWTIWKYGREGKLKTVRFGRTVRYDLEGSNGCYDNSGADEKDQQNTSTVLQIG